MAMSDDDRQAVEARLAPTGTAPVGVLAPVVDDGEELREIVVDAQGDVVAFTNERALFVAKGSGEAVAVGYDDVELRLRDAGLAVDVLLEGDRLVLAVARGTFARLAVVASGGPPGRASWLPVRTPPPRPEPEPAPPAPLAPFDRLAPPAPPGGATYAGEPAIRRPPPMPAAAGGVPAPAPQPPVSPVPPVPHAAPAQPVPQPPAPAPAPQPSAPAVPAMPPPGMPPAGWNPDPSGRHWWRWWDGIGWTDHVADGGAPFVDPLPPRA